MILPILTLIWFVELLAVKQNHCSTSRLLIQVSLTIQYS
jgi:hypothetical protein